MSFKASRAKMIAQRLRDEREHRGWTQAALAEVFATMNSQLWHPTTVQKVESGQRAVTALDLADYADAFGISADALLGRPRDGQLASAVANLTSNAQKMAGDIEGLRLRLRGEYDDVREAVSIGGETVTNLLEIGGSALLALSNARDWLNRLSNQFPIPS